MTVKSREALRRAQQSAQRRNHQHLESEHLLEALFDDPEGLAPAIARKVGSDPAKVREELAQLLEAAPKVTGAGSGQLYVGNSLGRLLAAADREASAMKDEYVSAEHFILAAAQDADAKPHAVLHRHGMTKDAVLAALKDVRGTQRIEDEDPDGKFRALEKYCVDVTAKAKDGKLDPVIGRDEEIRRTMQVLSMRRKNNPVLIGEPGVGKTAIVEGIAQRIASHDVPESLRNKRLLALDLGALIAGAKFRGEFEERLKTVLQEVTKSDGQIVLFIDEIHTLVGAGAAEGSMDASNMLKPALARGDLHCIGATTISEYRKYIEKDAALERRFQPVLVEPPSVDETIAILRGLQERYEVHHRIRIRDNALVAAATLSDRYISDRFLPDKAIDLVDEAASTVRIEVDSLPKPIDELERRSRQLEVERHAIQKDKGSQAKERLQEIERELAELKEKAGAMKARWQAEKDALTSIAKTKEQIDQLRTALEQADRAYDMETAARIRHGELPKAQAELGQAEARLTEVTKDGSFLREEVTDKEVAEVVSRWTGVPVTRMLESEVQKLTRMEDVLRQRVVGQEQAVASVSRAVRRARAGLKDPRRPIGSFLFLGPTGVGKTELAKALAEFLFADDSRVIRLDMSEYMEKHAVARLIGAPPGYVGYDQGGYLTEAVRRHPYSVILFDEIEKAHTEVFNVLLQVLDDGRLTDGKGRTVDMSNAVIVLTSNLGSEFIQSHSEEERPAMMAKIEEALASFFRPEFLNRVDDVVVFHRLGRDEMKKIVPIQLADLRNRISDRGLDLEVTDEALVALANRGYDPKFGARPLRRLIQTEVADPLAMALLERSDVEGGTARVDHRGGQFEVEVDAPADG